MIYLDNASTTFPKFLNFYRNTMDIYEKIGINFSRNNSKKSKELLQIKEKLKNNILEIYNSTYHKVILNSSATFSLNEILTGLDYTNIKTVYISPFEHNSVYRIIEKLKIIKNFDLKFIKFNKFDLDLDDMKLNFLSKKPDLVILNHSSNVFGNILPVEEIFNEVKKYKGITVLDTAQSGGILNFKKISNLCDFIVFAGHKNFYGPSGIGGYLYNPNIPLEPLLYGGTGIKSEDLEMPQDIPERFEAGSPNTLGIIGLKLATDELLKIGVETIKNKKNSNFIKLWSCLEKFSFDLEIVSPKENNIGIISVVGEEYSIKELEMLLESSEIIIRGGLHCAPLAHQHFSLSEGTIRFSVSYFNKDEEFIELENKLKHIF